MKHVFLDTNILVDQCFRRKKANDPSLVLMRLCQQGVLSAYTSSWCLMTMMYLMDEARGPEGRRIWTKKEILAETASLLSFVTVVEAGNGHFARAFTIGWADWEDAIIHAVAEGHGQIEVVVTNDRKYVNRTKKDPGVQALLPSDVLARLEAKTTKA
jgi:predicted nucleic acid-binding protein